MHTRLSSDQKQQVCSLYQQGHSTITLSHQFGISPTAICGLLGRRKIHRRSPHHARMKQSLNEHAFDEITEQSAYWIGFLMADGSVTKRKDREATIALVLSDKDGEHLYNFRRFLDSSHALTPIAQWKTVRLAVNSNAIAQTLARFGVLPSKSFSAKISHELEMDRHFWRGVIDGDGSIGVYNNRPRLELVGSAPLLEQFVAFVRCVSPVCTVSVRPQKSIYRVGLHGRYALAVISHLYTDCIVALPRKLDASLNILALGLQSLPPGADRSLRL